MTSKFVQPRCQSSEPPDGGRASRIDAVSAFTHGEARRSPMKTRPMIRLGLLLGAATLILAVACDKGGEMQSETRTVAAAEATSARVKVEMAVGTLRLDGTASELANADFRYNVAKWKPLVDYTVNSNAGSLTIHQPNAGRLDFNKDLTNEWDLHLNRAMPIDLVIKLGAGTSDLKLGGMNLTALGVETGAGETVVDLAGAWSRSLQAQIKGGAGTITVRLPRGVGVRVEADADLGNVEADGFARQSGAWVNGALGTSPVTLSLRVEAGVGNVKLVLAD